MRAPLLLPLALLALLAASSARAEAPQEERLVAEAQSFTRQAVRNLQEWVAAIRQSEAAQEARERFESGIEEAQRFFHRVKDKILTLREEAAPAS